MKIPHFLLAGFPPRTTDPKKPGIYLGAKGVQGPLVPTEGPPVLCLPLHCRVGVIFFSLFKKSCELHSESGHVQTMKKGISTAHTLHTADSSPLQATTQEQNSLLRNHHSPGLPCKGVKQRSLWLYTEHLPPTPN